MPFILWGAFLQGAFLLGAFLLDAFLLDAFLLGCLFVVTPYFSRGENIAYAKCSFKLILGNSNSGLNTIHL